MNVKELITNLQEAVDRGLPLETTVVIEKNGWYYILQSVSDPSDGSGDYDMWFTMFAEETSENAADSRFTYGGMP